MSNISYLLVFNEIALLIAYNFWSEYGLGNQTVRLYLLIMLLSNIVGILFTNGLIVKLT